MCNLYDAPEQLELELIWPIANATPLQWPATIAPRRHGPFLRAQTPGPLNLVVGQWALIPPWAKTHKLPFSTNNCRSEDAARKDSFRDAWRARQRCIIPATSFDEPNWETKRNVWWRFRRTDGLPWGLAGLWNTWTDRVTGEIHESYTMLTVNADDHPLMSRMHKPDLTLPPDQQDKRSIVAIEQADLDQWLFGDWAEAGKLIKPPAMELIVAGPV